MFARTLARQTETSAKWARGGMRYNSTLPIPPKIATPKSAQGPGASSARMEGVVGFYKSLPKGNAPQKRGGGIKARYFDGKNASGKPIVATLFTLFLIGYSIDYATHLRKFPPSSLRSPSDRKLRPESHTRINSHMHSPMRPPPNISTRANSALPHMATHPLPLLHHTPHPDHTLTNPLLSFADML